ncbi:nardilysin-like protein [Plasmopara halstedii]|uniref:Nardilysin-like protein n=1 Tax=Plasmopara halstedii TaxID=4781 RepID=A0A0P1B6H6_PLAHL|nr:nardilysin-like protein [Plasmopara halstedii]CEG49336.1 nardilysin-like protein [Plasmopara halstedii]|eukprot:XP_024585705.1 nardilysin-like protein [Plasmopara halstedii]
MDPVEQSKSHNDMKKYRLLTLPNALEVLLISTADMAHVAAAVALEKESIDEDDSNSSGEESECSDEDEDDESSSFNDDEEPSSGVPSRRAGACLTVGVGSFAEPEELPGLAHYLEHMLFMGSAKYPDENEFEAFLSAHGGYSNGATDNERTSYTFEVGPAHLESALDMFAHFFISPLLKAEAMDRELSAIESEFSQATQNDRIRTQQVLCDMALATHPYHRFSWGNKKSLQEIPKNLGIDVRSQILDFYTTFYSANIMKLVVCGENSLDELEKWVTKSFNAIPNKNVKGPSFAAFGSPVGAPIAKASFICKIIPVRDIHTLHLDWMIPPILGQHHQKPADYIASLLGHESQGSILSHLKKKGWISAVTAGVTDTDGYDSGTYAAKFDITMKLTQEGISQWENIAVAVFEYLHMLQVNGCPEWVFDELAALADISFRFREENSAVERCEELSEIMQSMFKVAPEDILRYDLFKGSFKKALVEEVLSHLTADSVCISIVSQTFDDCAEFQTQVVEEQWFGIRYTRECIKDTTVQRWKSAGLNSELHLPRRNQFIPKNFAIVDVEGVQDLVCKGTKFGKLWFKPDRVFATPRAHIALLLHLPSVVANVENWSHTQLYVKIVQDALNEYAYHANVADLMYSLQVKDTGLELIFGGFNDKLHLLVEVVVAALFGTEIDEARFEVLQEELMRESKNAITKVAQKAKYLRLQLLEKNSFPIESCLDSIKLATVESLKNYVDNQLWSGNARLDSFAHGNISHVEAIKLVMNVEEQLYCKCSPLQMHEIPQRYITTIPPTPVGFLLKERSENKTETNTQVEFYFQIGPLTLRSLAFADLLHQLMEEPLFDALRTKQELGYDVSCTVRVTNGILGFGVMVQSSMFAAEYISSCVNRFMIDFEEAIEMMIDKHFDDHVQAQILLKLEPDHNLLETTQRYWYEITTRRFAFDIDAQLAKEMETLTKSEIAQHYRKWILENPKKLIIQVIGRSNSAESVAHQRRKNASKTECVEYPQPIRIHDLYLFKSELPFYSDPIDKINNSATSEEKHL